jgi:hypothetical protein
MSDILGWFLVFWPALLIGAVLYFGRNFFPAWIKRRAEFGFDKELEKLRGEISRSETRLRSDLDASQRELESVRAASLSGATSRRIALDNKRLEAAQGIWNAVFDLGKLRVVAEMAGSLKLPEIAKRINSGDAKMRQAMDAMVQPMNIDNPPGTDAARYRPFVTETVWATYSAYSTILHISVVRLKMAQLGVTEAEELIKTDALNKIIVTALPHYEQFIKEHGPSRYHIFVDELENLVLAAIKGMLDGKDVDAAALERNAEILRAVNSVQVQAKAQAAISEVAGS